MRRPGSAGIGFEASTRLFVLLLVVFLLLVDVGLQYALSRLENVMVDEFDRRLLVSSVMVKERLEVSSLRALLQGKGGEEPARLLRKNLRSAALRGRLLRVTIIDKEYRVLLDSRIIEHPATVKLVEEDFPDLDPVWSGEDLFANVKSEGPLWTRYLFSPLSDGQKVYAVLAIGSDFSLHRRLLRMARSYMVVRILGMVSVVGVALFFVVSVLRPFRRLKETAEVIRHEAEGEEDSEFIISTFQRVIEDLRKKEAELGRLYAEQKSKAESLEEYNRYILSSMSGGVISADSSGSLVTFNRAAGEMLGIETEGAVGRPYEKVLPHRTLTEMLKGALNSGRIRKDVEIEVARGNVQSTLRVSSSVLRGTRGEVLGAALLLTDITELKRLQENILLKEKLASLGEMSAGIAHQFKNSVGSIIGFANLLKKKGSSIQTIDKIVKESMMLNDVVESFLSFARPAEVNPSVVDLGALIEEILEPLHEEMRNKGIDRNVSFGASSLNIVGDAVLLKQAFANLLRNGIDAMPDGGSLSIDSVQNGQMAVVKIRDTGRGIPKEKISQVFTPFFSLTQGGVGLGLPIAYKIITSHRGSIEIESEEGVGTTVTVHLPKEEGVNG